MPSKRQSTSFRGLVLVVGMALAATGCEKKKVGDAPDSAPAAVERAQWQSDFEGRGIVEWVSPADGRYLVIRTFDRDTDQNGKIEVRIGQHGEPEGDEPTLRLFDTRHNSSTELENLYPPSGHPWLAFIQNESVQLLRTGAGTTTEIPDVDARPDPNACLGPRGVSLSSDGEGIVVIESGGTSVRMGATRNVSRLDRVEFDGQVWRVRSLTPMWALVHLADSFPRARTSCVCSWCQGLASSLGNYGFEGSWRTLLVRRDGVKLTFEGATPTPLSAQIVLDEKTRKGGLRRIESDTESLERAASLDVDARFVTGAIGSKRFVRRGAQGRLFWSDGIGIDQPLDPAVRIVNQGIRQHLEAAYQSHLLVRVARGNEQKYASLDLETARVLDGPDSGRASSVHPSGWVLVASRKELAAFHMVTGVVQAIEHEGPVGAMDSLSFESRGEWFVVDPIQGVARRAETRPRFVTENGCYIRARGGRGRIEEGPFTLECARP